MPHRACGLAVFVAHPKSVRPKPKSEGLQANDWCLSSLQPPVDCDVNETVGAFTHIADSPQDTFKQAFLPHESFTFNDDSYQPLPPETGHKDVSLPVWEAVSTIDGYA